MDRQIQEARENFPKALDLAVAVLIDEFDFSIANILETYEIVVAWEAKLKSEKQEPCVLMREMLGNCKKELASYKEEFENDFLPSYEAEIRMYLKRQHENFTAESLATAKVFVTMAENNPCFTYKDWAQFLPNE